MMASLEKRDGEWPPLVCAPLRDALSSWSHTLSADISNAGAALTFLWPSFADGPATARCVDQHQKPNCKL